MNVGDLTPAMRAALATAPAKAAIDYPGARVGLRGLYHGATLSALARKGLVSRVHDRLLDVHEYYLTDAGLEAREEIRARAELRIEPHGFTYALTAGSPLYNDPDEGGTCTLSAAVRKTGVGW